MDCETGTEASSVEAESQAQVIEQVPTPQNGGGSGGGGGGGGI